MAVRRFRDRLFERRSVVWGRSSLLFSELGFHHADLDLEVLYIGQAYGAHGARSAIGRLQSHETLQGIYSEAVRRSPDREVYLFLLSVNEPYALVLLSPTPGDPDDDLAADHRRITSKMTEQQCLNWTGAALIRYFKPPYNKEFKGTFPNPAHKTYSECCDLDLNTVGFELETSEVLRVKLFSEAVPRNWWHLGELTLHSAEERRAMFDFSPD